MLHLPTPTQIVNYNALKFYLKRDDLIHNEFSGNKGRKFFYYLQKEFSGIKKLISYGSNQSNAMYSLSVLAKLKQWEFVYYTDHINEYLQKNPCGNYQGALENGMQLYLGGKEEFFRQQISEKSNSELLFINEGGAIKEAQVGLKVLTKELEEFIISKELKDCKIFLPSGTGTTALFLQKYLSYEVLTTPCVGDAEYLKQQFYTLESDTKYHPTIIQPKQKYHFGKLYTQHYQLWKSIKQHTGIEFDLLYDPIGLETLFMYMNENKNTEIIYLHQGGILGNQSMIPRYERKISNLN